MARRRRKPKSPYADIYTQLAIQRMIQKQQEARALAMQQAQQQAQAEQERLTATPTEGWSAAPGARNTNVPFVMGEGGQHGYDELYAGSPYADQGRNWASPEQWARYNDSSRIPDWLRTPESGLGPAFEPSPELQMLREQVGTLRGMGAQNLAMRQDNAGILDQLARAVQYATEDREAAEAYDQASGVKPVPPGIANIYGPYDDSQDRYADAPPLPGMIEEAFPENAMPPPAYGWGAQEVAPDRGYIVSDPITRSGNFPDKFSATPAGRQRAATTLDFARPLEYQRGPIPKGVKGAMEVQSSRPLPPVGLMPVGEDSPPTAGPWAEEAAATQGPPPPQLPEPGTLWDNYPHDFTLAMHEGDPDKIKKVTESLKLFDW